VFWVGISIFDVALCVSLYLVRMLAITAGYHRYFAHRSYKTSRAFQFLLGLFGCTAMQYGPIRWASMHRHHHRHADDSKDLHSPRTSGFWWSHVGWILAGPPRPSGTDVARDFQRYPELRWLDSNFWLPAIAMAFGCWLVGGWSGFVWGFVISSVLVYHATFSVNSIAHIFGRRRYQTSDDSRNNSLVALLTLGEGWHNNHHHFPASARQGFFWWEIDFTYMALRVLSVFRIVWDLRQPPRRVYTTDLEGRAQAD
jgi:stearoyl-CoA desaturase (delta-9 desaturase)